MTKLNWRLSKLPTVDELLQLVKDKIITQEEAKEILFNEQTEEDRDKKSLEAEVKFLRELVTRLSNNQTTRIIETIKEVERPWKRWNWFGPYERWYTTVGSGNYTLTATNANVVGSNTASDFSDIKTF